MNKVMLISFFVARGAVYQHVVPHPTTINALYCCEFFRTLKRHGNKKRPNLKTIWLLQHNNAKLHTASIIREFSEKGKIQFLAHPTYGSCFVQFLGFRSSKWKLCNKYFESYVELVSAINRFF